ncbi:MAG: type II secretion system protein [Candidatus Liptonbacteria bacterium]|nr:type II secretion system protein [Candidatus Liptonbacteria bacterium]
MRSGEVKKASGFTLIELVVVIAVVMILGGAIIAALNPAGQVRGARNTQRRAHAIVILNGVKLNMADHQGQWTCAAYPAFANTSTSISSAAANIHDCLVPLYAPELPIDPVSGTFTSAADYDTGYDVYQEPAPGSRVVVCARYTEIPPANKITCVVR